MLFDILTRTVIFMINLLLQDMRGKLHDGVTVQKYVTSRQPKYILKSKQ